MNATYHCCHVIGCISCQFTRVLFTNADLSIQNNNILCCTQIMVSMCCCCSDCSLFTIRFIRSTSLRKNNIKLTPLSANLEDMC